MYVNELYDILNLSISEIEVHRYLGATCHIAGRVRVHVQVFHTLLHELAHIAHKKHDLCFFW
jgi:hypothetical protein